MNFPISTVRLQDSYPRSVVMRKLSQEENLAGNVSSYTSFSPQKVSMYQSAYHDNGIRNFQKLRVDYRNVELDAVSDKDPGENSYLDFYSLGLSLKDVSIFSAIDLGNYSISLGNGMLFSNASNDIEVCGRNFASFQQKCLLVETISVAF